MTWFDTVSVALLIITHAHATYSRKSISVTSTLWSEHYVTLNCDSVFTLPLVCIMLNQPMPHTLLSHFCSFAQVSVTFLCSRRCLAWLISGREACHASAIGGSHLKCSLIIWPALAAYCTSISIPSFHTSNSSDSVSTALQSFDSRAASTSETCHAPASSDSQLMCSLRYGPAFAAHFASSQHPLHRCIHYCIAIICWSCSCNRRSAMRAPGAHAVLTLINTCACYCCSMRGAQLTIECLYCTISHRCLSYRQSQFHGAEGGHY